MTQDTSIRVDLMDAGIDAEAAAAIAAAARWATANGGNAQLEALFGHGGNGQVKLRSVRFRHWLVNWKKVMFEALPSAAGAMASTNPWATGGLLLKALGAIIDASSIEIGDREQRLLLAMWRDKESPPKFPKRAAQQVSGLNDADFAAAVRTLEQLGALEDVGDEFLVRTEEIWLVA